MFDFGKNNNLATKIVCEYPLPIPVEDFSEEEKILFESIDWTTKKFFTFSFFEQFDLDSIVSYNISEDGTFYAETTVLETVFDENGKADIVEKDGGIESREFTGEIYFSTEFFGDEKTNLESNFDYIFSFRALLFKGDLKELELDEYKKKDNSERKKLAQMVEDFSSREKKRDKSIFYKVVHYFFMPFTFLLLVPYNLLGKFITFLDKIESKIKSKILKL